MIRTYSGTLHDLTRPDPSLITMEDMAWGLSHENRYNGHTQHPFSVGQHIWAMCLYLDANAAPRPVRQAAFIHDLPEFILKDITSPLKSVIGPEYDRLTVAWENAICQYLGMSDGTMYRKVFDSHIKPLDRAFYVAETTILHPNPEPLEEQPDEEIMGAVSFLIGVEPEQVRAALLNYHKELFA